MGGQKQCSWLPQCLSEYQTTKSVVIRSPYLQIPNMLLNAGILFYIVAISLGYNCRFMASEEAITDADMGTLKPMSNWGSCSNSDFDCNLAVGDESDLSYCSANKSFGVLYKHGEKFNRSVEGCWASDIHMEPASRIIVPTMISFLHQSWDSSKGDWLNDEVHEYYVQNIESFTVRFRHAFVTQSGMKKSSIDMDGILKASSGTTHHSTGFNHDAKGEKYKFARGPKLAEHQEMYDESDPWSSIADLEQCGTDPSSTQYQNMSCSRTLWGNVISVKKLLEFAGIGSLDDEREGMGGATYRQAGLGIRARIVYQNLDDIWKRFFLHGFCLSSLLFPPPAYTLSLDTQPMAGDFVVKSDVTQAVHALNGKIDLNRRLVKQMTGISLSLSAGGTLHHFSFREFLLAGVKALALLKLSQMLVESFLVRIYRGVADTQHVSAMYFSHKNQGSVSETKFRKHLERVREEDPDGYEILITKNVPMVMDQTRGGADVEMGRPSVVDSDATHSSSEEEEGRHH